MPFCVKCGERLDENQELCPNCGEAHAAPAGEQDVNIEPEAAETVETEAANEAVVTFSDPEAEPGNGETATPLENVINLEETKPKKKKTGLVIGVAAVLVAAIAVVCFFAMGGFAKPYEKLTYMVNAAFDTLSDNAKTAEGFRQQLANSTDGRLMLNLEDVPALQGDTSVEMISTAAVEFSYNIDRENNKTMIEAAASLSGMELISMFYTLDETGLGAYNEAASKYVRVPWESLNESVPFPEAISQSSTVLQIDEITPMVESLREMLLVLINENTVTLEKKCEIQLRNGETYICNKYILVPTEAEWSVFMQQFYEFTTKYSPVPVDTNEDDVNSAIADAAATFAKGGTTITVYESDKSIVRFGFNGILDNLTKVDLSWDVIIGAEESSVYAIGLIDNKTVVDVEMTVKTDGDMAQVNGSVKMDIEGVAMTVSFSCEASETKLSAIGLNYGTYHFDVEGSNIEEKISFTITVGAEPAGGSSHVFTLDRFAFQDTDLSGAKVILTTTDTESVITWPAIEPETGTMEDLSEVLSMGVNPLLGMMLG